MADFVDRMPADLPSWVSATLSIPRFTPYLEAAGSDHEAAVRLYWWNVRVSEAFYTPLHCLELALRNALNSRLRERFARSDWWVAVQLTAQGSRNLEEAHRKVRGRAGKDHSADDIVAQLTFGFWVSLVSRGAAYDRTLWVPALHKAFPHYRGGRAQLHDNLTAMLLLRNRIMHHEPVHHRDLAADHTKILRLLGYISPMMVEMLAEVDRVEDTLRREVER
ncbi:hypothetical protein [Actinoalloteichus hymeniacidonis]|uniref:Abi-like protein n=1 Tax=Actinoalloteichus hymeniacidonis TaxID=340345 RepID=A0AAC9MXG3_9PSEU|nr:hypothetical protein [Actinoalloteichus hymeniacidonis]AOS61847.1 Abi-like protein [Actinoalloteichus hymeniacidonis]MBB5910133.1 hypothetical protein [Actinoalloteichus hymeniacidonis]